ncbi:MAG: hypothetical protein L0228_17445 [Planctomycetes bacterium]|nr:hypothetical protein [Planctomycetota bacterium]
MTNTELRHISLACLAVAMLTSPAAAQSREWGDASDLYGRGVHAYFAGRSSDADFYLSRALAVSPSDPRLFYFRGLSRLQSGRAEEARADMEIGASLEAKRPGRFAVGTALARVQGVDRLLLEKFRQQARTAAMTDQRLARTRIEQRAASESAALRQKVIVPLDEFREGSDPRALSAEELQQRTAAAKSRAATPALPSQGPTPPPATTEADPFQDDSAAARDSTAAPAAPPSTTAPEAAEPVETTAPAVTPADAPADTEGDPFSDIQ